MKLYELQSRTSPMNVIDIISTMKRECSKTIDIINKTPLFRGSNIAKLSFGDSNVGEARKSANTENYYTIWVDNDKRWDKFPKRSRSFICSTSEGSASGYGEPSLIIPFDNANIAICPEDDFWVSFERGPDDLSDLNSFAAKLLSIYFNKDRNDLKLDTEPKLRQAFSKITAKAISQKLTKLREKSVDDTITEKEKNILTRTQGIDLNILKDGTLADLYNEILSPKNFTQSLAKSLKKVPENREVYIQGKCIFIPRELDEDVQVPLLDFFKDHDTIGEWISP